SGQAGSQANRGRRARLRRRPRAGRRLHQGVQGRRRPVRREGANAARGDGCRALHHARPGQGAPARRRGRHPLGSERAAVDQGVERVGLKGKLPLLTLGETVNETYLRSVGDAALGVVSWLSYSPVLDTGENKRFVQAFNKKFRKDPVYNNHLGYLAAKASGEAMKAVNANVEDKARFLAALRKVSFEAPGGSFRFDDKQNAIIPTYIRRVDKVGGKLQNTVLDVVQDVDQFWKPPKP